MRVVDDLLVIVGALLIGYVLFTVDWRLCASFAGVVLIVAGARR